MFLAALFLRAEKLKTAQCVSHAAVQTNEPELCLSNVDVKKDKELQKNT